MNRTLIALSLTSLLATTGCYDEGIDIVDLRGSVRIPKEFATITRDVVGPDGTPTGETVSITDVRALGPVYIGLYASVRNDIEPYPHPERVPTVGSDALNRGQSLPYGGTTIGDFRNACFEFFTCKVISGRYTDYDEILEWFREAYDDPATTVDDGPEITTGEFIRQTCFELLEYTSDEEIQLLPPDRDGSGVIDAADLDFVEEGDFFVADFEILQAEFFPGMSAWAYIDQADPGSATHKTCNGQQGYFENTYNRRYQAGVVFADVLNLPWFYLESNDYVAGEAFIWDDPFAPADITIDVPIGAALNGGL